ncbi:vWA domain-containing protein [Aporhodopirellula aestuarii]|uniref:VWA domain-containing protein n=1 Tax=Aporhodopirellula aestuarii TaxID=2950107 RepID=A0ABT0UD12_9BACT|nr:vWA domain-containing protein [Aporhodopirellula aestuarii]MCM2374923.1 VWA domain-containing protein [Aporhodopirellula aestuarii]
MKYKSVLLAAIVLLNSPHCVAGEPLPTVSAAMRTLFSPASVPARKTMGLLQRNFLDVAGQKGELEIAIVVDGTESMADELAGVRQSINRMIADLVRLRGDSVRVALVIYRDSGSPSGDVETPLPDFVSDPQIIEKGIERLQPESGAPFFYELMDVGLHEAITNLPWSEDPSVAKWILLFGDAPPYEVAYHDEAFPDAKRRFADELLISLASRRGIQIHCVLCSSTDKTKESYQQSIGQTRRVMDRLASQTGGMVLDLSYPVIREALAGVTNEPQLEYTSIEPISEIDVTRYQKKNDNDQVIRIAVLPHEPIETMGFGPDRTSTQVATALAAQFRTMPGVRVKSVLDVEKQVRRMRAEGLSGSEAIRGLAGRMRVDYIVWGRIQESPAITSVAFRRTDGRPIIRVAHNGSPDGLADVVLTAAASSPEQDAVFSQFAKRMLRSTTKTQWLSSLSSDPPLVKNLLTSMGALEQSLGLEIGSAESDRMLAQGKAAATLAIQMEPAHPIANWLLANIAYNQALAAFNRGESESASDAMKLCRSSLRLADQNKNKIQSSALRSEIEADYRLIVRKEFDEAIGIYETMTDPSMPDDSQARGHWMLAGLYAGDWGMDATRVDPERSREHVVALMANWPDRPETELLRRWLRWDDATKSTRHNHLPRLNDVLVGIE